MINKNDLRKAISSIAISNAKRNTIYKAFSDLDSITKEEFDSVKFDISKVVESMLTKDTVGKADGVASLDSNGSVPIEQLCNIDTTLFLIVRELPTTDIKTNKIYLVPNQDGQDNNVYVEYLYVENVWEKLGEFKPEVDINSQFCFNDDGTITSEIGSGIRGNGVWYNDDNEDNNIPFEYIKNLYDYDGNGRMSIENIDMLSFFFNYIRLSAGLDSSVNGGKAYLYIESFDTRYEHTNIPKYVCIQAENHILYIESKNGTSTSVFATDGSHFDLNKKADLVDGKLKAEQLPKLVNITTASTAEEVITKFNALLADLKAKGYMEADTAQ